MANARLIDATERVRKKPMRVLVLGMCRTGTSSIQAALTKLGYTPHHMSNVMANPSEIALWHEAVNVTFLPDSERPAHQRGLPPYGRAEFDKLLADYDAVTDLPGALFVEQLVKAYPDAKVILTNRKYEDWEKSMNGSIWMMIQWKLSIFCRVLNVTPLTPFLRLVSALFRVHNGNNYGGPKAKEAYERHYNNVRRLVPKERLLEFGPDFRWEPLCEFLGHEAPEESYPRLNEKKTMRERLDAWWREMAMYLTTRFVLPGVVAGLAMGSYFKRGSILGFLDGTRPGGLLSK